MNTLHRFTNGINQIPASVTWYLADIAEAKGKQELFANKTPQKLKVLREHALIESAVSSNRIEGVEIEQRRIGTVIFGQPLLKDRNEEEICGYRQALSLIHDNRSDLPFSTTTIKKLHKLTRGEIWDAGEFKEKDGDIIERLPNGEIKIRFKTVSALKTPESIEQLIDANNILLKDHVIHPLIVIAACNLDFLCIHPFRDGNGRVSRLLLLLQLYQSGYEVGRYLSIERLIEEHKERYYETLEQSSEKWHSGQHDPWPYIHFILYILKKAYSEFTEKVNKQKDPVGSKTELVLSAIARFQNPFTIVQLSSECPSVSREMIRKILKDQQSSGNVLAEGRGPGARWINKGITS